MISIQNLDTQFPITEKTVGKKYYYPLCKKPHRYFNFYLVSLKITRPKYKKESFKTPVFGSIFSFCNITSSETFPVKIKPNVTVRILYWGFYHRWEEHCRSIQNLQWYRDWFPLISAKPRLYPVRFSIQLENDFICKDPHLPTSPYKSKFSTACSSLKSIGA